MKLLALDTSSVACSVAVLLGDAVFEQHEEQPREHTRLLMPMIRSVLEKADIELSELDGLTTLRLTQTATEDFSDDRAEFTRECGLEGWKWFIQDSLKAFLEKRS